MTPAVSGLTSSNKPGIIILGAGGVGNVAAQKAAMNTSRLGKLTIASRSTAKAEAIRADILARGNLQDTSQAIEVRQVDAMQTAEVVKLIQDSGARILVNVASNHTNLSVLQACAETGCAYLDTSVYEKPGEEFADAPWYANYEWELADEFAAKGVTAVLSIGFDPGVTNAFAAKAQKSYFDVIDSIDILDVNAGDHGRYFATNFNPVINLREIMEDVIYWEDGAFRTIPPHSRSFTYDFPKLGQHKLFSVGHDEMHSLFKHIPAKRIEFWMGFGERYLQVFETLYNLGLLSSQPVDVQGKSVVPLELLSALLPDPASLAEGYQGECCIGNLVRGTKDGKPRQVFLHSFCDHKACYAEVGSQAISYTTGVPAIAAALCIADGSWDAKRMVNVEELDPDPFLEELARQGIGWELQDFGQAISPHEPLDQDTIYKLPAFARS